MKDWKTWAIVALAAWCAINSIIEIRMATKEYVLHREYIAMLRTTKSAGKYGTFTHNGREYTYEQARKEGLISDEIDAEVDGYLKYRK